MTQEDVINAHCPIVSIGPSVYPPFTTFNDIESLMAKWGKLRQEDLFDINSKLTIQSDSIFLHGSLYLHCTLNGVNGESDWSFYICGRNKGMTGDGPTDYYNFGSIDKAVLIIPGSCSTQPGQIGSEGIAIVSGASTYENDILYQKVCSFADGFVYLPPGSECNNPQGSNGNNLYQAIINNRLMSLGSSLSLVSVIECCAILKALKTPGCVQNLPTYSKTAVTGLSKGAWLSFLVGMMGGPTACFCASGVSLASPTFGFAQAGTNTTPNDMFDENIITGLVSASPTKFKLTYSTTNDVAICLYEAQTSATQGLLNFDNVSVQVHSQGHGYPSDTVSSLVGMMS